jgi:general secretion pathway protein D
LLFAVVLAAPAARGQTADPRRESDRLLAQARQAIAEGDLDRADQLVNQASALGVQYDPLTARFEGPEKVRRDIAMLRAGSRPGATQAGAPPASPFNGAGDGRYPALLTPADPIQRQADRLSAPLASSTGLDNGVFAGRSPVDPNTIQHNDPVSAARGGSFLPGSPASSPPGGDGKKTLFDARRALAAGDLDQAAVLVDLAKRSGASFAPHEDTPARVEDLIQRQRQLAAAPGDPQSKARQQAQLLLEQAEAMLRYNDVAAARRLAEIAKTLPVRYQPYEATPDQLLERIAAAQGTGSTLPATAAKSDGNGNPALSQARALLAQAKLALEKGQPDQALELAQQAEAIHLPQAAFDDDELRPWKLRADIQRALQQRGPVGFAGYNEDNAPRAGGSFPGSQSMYTPEFDRTRNTPAAARQPTPAPFPGAQAPGEQAPGGQFPGAGGAPGNSGAEEFVRQGLNALRAGDQTQARRLLLQAWELRQELDPVTLQMVQDHLSQLSVAPQAEPLPAGGPPTPLQAAEQKRLVLQQKVQREIISEQAAADRILPSDPLGALQKLQDLRDRVGQTELEADVRKAMLTLVDRAIGRTQTYIDEHRADIETNAQNDAVLADLELSRKMKLEQQNTLATLVDKFNELIDQQRYPEAEMVAKQAREIAPQEEVVQNLMWKAKFARRIAEGASIRERSEGNFNAAMMSVDESDIPFDDREPWQLMDPHRWEQLTADRLRQLEGRRRPMTEAERIIREALKQKVAVSFTNRPLADVLAVLGSMTKINVVLDPQGLAAEGVTSATPVTMNLDQPISLESALNLILQPLSLSHVVRNEVLHVTSEQTTSSAVYPLVYNVADLVIPIPNFIPSYNIGLPSAIREAHNAIGYGGPINPVSGGAFTLAANEGAGAANGSVLAQMGGANLPNGTGRIPQQLGSGPGGIGGGSQADYDSLIELVTSTISPETWNEVGGPGAVERFETNLSLVISQTQEVHEQVADLLEQLRRLQDLQVTIEVRFITLNDDFFERIGIDFDFDFDDQSGLIGDGLGGFINPPGGPPDEGGPTTVIGLDPMGNPTADLDLSFDQGSFGSALPQFGGFDAATAANFGFAILSDIEVFFLLQAAQGDQRSNILQAPKVTLFNGQQAFVSDTSQTPFVTSVVPVVGDFAAAHQPVIVVLSEGTSLSVQAVVSNDRRFVRLTLVPFFSRIDSVQEFTFEGKQTSDSGTTRTDATGTRVLGTDNAKITTEGSTVQLPTFSFTTVTTTVSVPDGGTVLLGGIKRLSEGRTERGVPILDKLPYINRLFKNVGIGRTTQSLMMMVTPRIIIQEEEEERAVGRPLTNRNWSSGSSVARN